MHRWKLSALAAAALVSVSLTATDARALALDRLSIQSALGEPLRAEVELPRITAAEADSLKAVIASPAVFRAQGMEYTAAASQLRVQLQRRADGSAMLRLSSVQPLNEPFIDLVIDASWSAGHIVRSYTLLLDPPTTKRLAPAMTAAPQIGAAAAPAAPVRAATARPASQATAVSPVTPAANSAPANPQNSAAHKVRSGDTASHIARTNRPAGVSLDQMLVAMLRANPHAFISGNVNRMKAGAVLKMPDEAAALATPVSQARQMVAAQSQDFNRYRRQLAGAAPVVPVTAAQRSASGSITAEVDDKKPTSATPDKLTLSKGALQASQADERLAQEKQAQGQTDRLAELSRNMNELQQVAGAATANAAAAGAAAPGASAAGIPVTGVPIAGAAAPGTPVAGTPVAGDLQLTAIPADATSATDPAAVDPAAVTAAAVAAATAAAGDPAATPITPPAVAPAPVVPAPAAPEPAAPGFLDTLAEDPTLPLAGVGLLALLLGYGGWRLARRRRQRDTAGDSLLSSDSVFASGHGQRVDTEHSQFGSSGSSTAYSHSQLDTGGEVDPLAEADVYLAYGRDLQAEEILKEALRTQPERIALHQKLADIYAKRQDRKGFETVAQAVSKLTQRQGADWQHLAEQGRVLDADHPLYKNLPLAAADLGVVRAQPQAPAPGVAPVAAAAAIVGLAAAKPTAATPPDSELGIDFELTTGLESAPVAKPAAVPAPAAPATSLPDLDFEPIAPLSATTPTAVTTPPLPSVPDSAFDALAGLPTLARDEAPAAATVSNPAAADATALPELEFSLDSPPAGPARAADAKAQPADAAAGNAFNFLEYDMGKLSLDLGATTPADALSQSSQAAAEDPLATKLALAQEFAAIGDNEGARTLIEEVINEAEGELKTQAQRLLSEID